VLDAQVCQVSTLSRATLQDMLFILHTVPVVFSADYDLVRNSVLSLLELLNIQVVTRESESGESAWNSFASVFVLKGLKGAYKKRPSVMNSLFIKRDECKKERMDFLLLF